MNLEAVRNWQFGQMENSIKSIEALLALSNPDDLTTYRDSGDGWTVLEVLCHLRDYEDLFYQRARMMVNHDDPPLSNPDPDAMAESRKYNEQDIQTMLAEWKGLRAEFLTYLRERAETDWERPGIHPRRGNFTLHDQLFLTVWHDMNHIEQMTRILREKQ